MSDEIRDAIHGLDIRLTKLEASKGTWGHLITGGIAVAAVASSIAMPFIKPEKPAIIYVTEDEVANKVKATVDGKPLKDAEAYQLGDGTTVLKSGNRRWFVRGGKFRRLDGSEGSVELKLE